MPTGEHFEKELDRHGLFSGDTNALQSVKLSTAKEKAKELQLAGGLDLLSKVQSVIRRAEMVPNPTLFGENSTLDARTTKPPIMCTNLCDSSVGYGNPGTPVRLAVGEIIQEKTEPSTTARREGSLKKRQKIHTNGELEENSGLDILQEVNQYCIPASNREFQDSFQAVSPCLGQEFNVCLTTEDEMMLDRNMQRIELLLTKRLPKDSIRTPIYPALLEMKIEATHNAQIVVNKSFVKSGAFCNGSECSL